MATSYFDDTDERTPVGDWMRGLGRRTMGLLLLAAAGFLALALFGFDANDPSLNRATGAAVSNPAGAAGAIAADLLLQTFGRAGWLVPLVAFFWGLRMAANRQLVWPWLPLAALPLALLASTAFLAGLPEPGAADWPFRVGLGGIVGDFELLYLTQHVDSGLYGWFTGIAALVFGIAALGLRWRESTWALGKVGIGSRWLGRQIGGAAQATSAYSGRLIDEGRRNLRLRRAAAVRAVGAFPEPVTPDEMRPGLLERLVERFRRRAGGEVAEDLLEAAETAPVERPRPLRRAAREATPPPAAEPRPAAGGGLRQAPTLADEAKQGRSASQRTATPAEPPLQGDLPMNAFVLPRMDMLGAPKAGSKPGMSKAQLDEVSRQLESVLDDFGVRGEIIDAKPGPVVTLFELEPAPGTRAARVISLADDIARSLCALSVRVAVVPGRNVIGIELPNESRETVYLRTLLQSDTFARSEARLALALGKDISGNPIVVELARMPHLLIAGTTGAGKSVAINAMILSLLYRLTPDQCRIIMIDPKVIELSVYEDIPHLLAPVVTEPHKAVVALKWVVR
jgi:S-DNA-T family DNA segregation ATPase FtsK/SpoIIIE